MRFGSTSFIGWLVATSSVGAHATDAVAAPPSVETETPTTLLVTASGGSGSGSVGLTGRLGLQVDYWPSDHVGVGVAGAVLGQTELSFFGSKGESHWFVGPAISLRTSESPNYAFVTASFGYMRGHWSHPGDVSFVCLTVCDDRPGERFELSGLAGAIGLGYATGEGAWRMGVLGLVDATAPSHSVSLSDGTALDTSVVTITLNFTLNLGLY